MGTYTIEKDPPLGRGLRVFRVRSPSYDKTTRRGGLTVALDCMLWPDECPIRPEQLPRWGRSRCQRGLSLPNGIPSAVCVLVPSVTQGTVRFVSSLRSGYDCRVDNR